MLNDRELATVLAALRYWQRNVLDNEGSGLPDEWDVATCGTMGLTPLKAYQVDTLCERLNASPPPIRMTSEDDLARMQGCPVFLHDDKPKVAGQLPHESAEEAQDRRARWLMGKES